MIKYHKYFISYFALFALILNVKAQSFFDKAEKYLIENNLQVSYGIQSAWYKYSNIRYINEEHNSDIYYQSVLADDDPQLDFIKKGQAGVVQFRIKVGIKLSDKYSVNFLGTHLTYKIKVEEEYYAIGTFNGIFNSGDLLFSNHFQKLEHSNGINIWSLGITRSFNFTIPKLNNVSFELGLTPNIGLVGTASQAVLINPNRVEERYDPENSLAGYSIAGDFSFVSIIRNHYLVTLNFNYFQLQIEKAKLTDSAFLRHRIRGYNWGLNLGYRF